MMLSWELFATPDSKFQTVFFLHSRDWVFPIKSISDSVFKAAFETLSKFGQDSHATRIFAPQQNKKDESLAQFHTALLAAKKRLPEHYQNKVSLYFFGLYGIGSNEFRLYTSLPKWISVFEFQKTGDLCRWENQSHPSRERTSIQTSQDIVHSETEFLFYFGNVDVKNVSIQSLASQTNSLRLMDAIESQNSLLEQPLTSLKIKSMTLETGFREIEL
jgi:hypothetical protein